MRKKKMLSTCQDQFHSIVVGKYAYLDAKSESRYMGFLYGTYMGHLYVSKKLYICKYVYALDTVSMFQKCMKWMKLIQGLMFYCLKVCICHEERAGQGRERPITWSISGGWGSIINKRTAEEH